MNTITKYLDSVLINSKNYLLIILSIWLFVYLIPIFNYPISDPGESYYSASSYEMFKHHEFIVPILNNQIYFAKPILVYWFYLIPESIFGIHDWSGRIGFSLIVLVNIIQMFFYTKKFFNQKIALISSIGYLIAPLIVLNSKTSPIDILFSSLLNIAIIEFIQSITYHQKNYHWLFFYIAIGLATLTKGIAAAVLFLGGVFIWLIIYRPKLSTTFKLIQRSKLLLGILIYLGITLPWFVIIGIKTKGLFIKVFFMYENYARFLGRTNMSRTNYLYFIPVILYGLLPINLFIANIKGSFQKNKKIEYRHISFLFSYSLFVLVFFSISKTKLDTYIMPLFSSLSIVLASAIYKLSQNYNNLNRVTKYIFRISTYSLIVLQIIMLTIPRIIYKFDNSISINLLIISIIVNVIIFLLALKSHKLFKSQNYLNSIIISFLSLSLGFITYTCPLINSYVNYNQNDLSDIYPIIKKSNIPVLFFHGFRPSLMYYGQKPINSFFHTQIIKQNLFLADNYLILTPNKYLKELNLPLGYKLILQNQKYSLIKVSNTKFVAIPTLEESFSDKNAFCDIISGKSQCGPFTVPYAIGNYFKQP